MQTIEKPLSLKNSLGIIIGFALIKLIIHLVTNLLGGYGIFRDELYYVACSNHLDLGYVDQPPLSLYILAFSRLLFGDSAFALRLLPALAGAVTVFLTGLLTRGMGGKFFAQAAACTASIVSCIFLAYNTVYSMNAFDVLFWTLAAYIAVRLVETGDPKYWLQLGLVIGLGAFNKIDMLWCGAGLAAGFILTPMRSWLKTRWPWLAAVIAFLLFLPYVIWNITHDFAHLEFIRNAVGGKYSGLTPGAFLAGQIFIQNPVTLPLWLAGLFYLLFTRNGRAYRPLGIAYIFVLVILLANGHSKPEYLAPAYGVLFAAGGVAFERWFSRDRLRWLKPVLFFLTAAGIVFAPAVLPVLPVETYISYSETLGIKPSTPEGNTLGKLPQFYADMFGWEEKAQAAAKAFHRLSAEEQAKCAIFGDNYGRSGAVDYWAEKYNLPRSIGKHNNYWIWGPRDYTGEVMIIIGGDLNDKKDNFESVEVVDTLHSEYCMPYENNLRIYLCRKLKVPLKDLWPRIKVFD